MIIVSNINLLDEATNKAVKWLIEASGNKQKVVTLEDKPDLSEMSEDEELIFVSLEASGQFQNCISPSHLAELLASCHLPISIKNISLLISDISKRSPDTFFSDPFAEVEPKGMPMSAFGQRLADLLVTKYQFNQKLSVYDSSRLGLDYTFILLEQSPESKTMATWKVYGIHNPDSSITAAPTLKKLIESKQKKLLWQGNDIFKDWLHTPQRTSIARVTAEKKPDFTYP